MTSLVSNNFNLPQAALHSSDSSALESQKKRTAEFAVKFCKKPCFERATARELAQKINVKFNPLAQSAPPSLEKNPRVINAISDSELVELLNKLRSSQ